MILVTGGAGFIGSHIVERLTAQGELVYVFDNLSRSMPTVGLMPFDVTNMGDVLSGFLAAEKAFGCHVTEVIHLAYINGTKTFYERPYDVLNVGMRGMLNVLDACKRFGVRRFVLMSSSEVCRAKLVDVGEQIPLVIPDPYNPRYSYSAGKIASEMLALHCGLFDRLLIARPFNVYGPGMSPGHVIPDFIEQARKNEPVFEILGDGNETRSFCYVDDLVDGFMLMREKGEHNGIYNIGTPVETTIRDLAWKVVNAVTGRYAMYKFKGKLREGDVPRRKPDITKLADLGYRPKVSLDEGLRRMIS